MSKRRFVCLFVLKHRYPCLVDERVSNVKLTVTLILHRDFSEPVWGGLGSGPASGQTQGRVSQRTLQTPRQDASVRASVRPPRGASVVTMSTCLVT